MRSQYVKQANTTEIVSEGYFEFTLSMDILYNIYASTREYIKMVDTNMKTPHQCFFGGDTIPHCTLYIVPHVPGVISYVSKISP